MLIIIIKANKTIIPTKWIVASTLGLIFFFLIPSRATKNNLPPSKAGNGIKLKNPNENEMAPAI